MSASQHCCRQERKAQRRQRSAWAQERAQYGKTESGKYVDCQSLEQLCQLDYARPVAAEALRQVSKGSCAGARLPVPGTSTAMA